MRCSAYKKEVPTMFNIKDLGRPARLEASSSGIVGSYTLHAETMPQHRGTLREVWHVEAQSCGAVMRCSRAYQLTTAGHATVW